MREETGDIWRYVGHVDVIFISTNLEVKSDGTAIMGRGMAFEAARRWPNIPRVLGAKLTQGNYNPVPLWKAEKRTELWSFPTKDVGLIPQTREQYEAWVLDSKRDHFGVGKYLPSWAQKSSLSRIEESARYVQSLDWIESAVLPRVGAGWGALDWNEVYNSIHTILDDRFISVTWE